MKKIIENLNKQTAYELGKKAEQKGLVKVKEIDVDDIVFIELPEVKK